MSNELTALTDFTRNLFKHAYYFLPWFCSNSGLDKYKVPHNNRYINRISALKKQKDRFFGDTEELLMANAVLTEFYENLKPAGDPQANELALSNFISAWELAWKERSAFQLRGHEVKLMKYFHEIFSDAPHSHMSELLSMARLLDMEVVKTARLVSNQNGWTAKGAFAERTKAMQTLQKKLLGSKIVTPESINAASAKKSVLYKQYQQIIKDRKHAAQTRLIEIFDEEEWFPTVDSDTLRARLKKEGLQEFLPAEFDGRLGVQPAGYPLTFYTHQELELEMPPLNNVKMNKNYGNCEEGKEYSIHPVTDGTYYCETTALVGDSRVKYYTMEYKRRARHIKYDKVKKLTKVIADVRERMLGHIDSNDRDTWVRALMCLFIDSTCARIGNPESAKGKKRTYGVTTLLTKKHTRVKNNKIIISYDGKHGQKQKHEFFIYRTKKERSEHQTDSVIADKLLALINENNEYLFTRSDGNPFTPQQVNDYFTGSFKQISNNGLPEGGAGSPCTLHNLRNMHATRMFLESAHEFDNGREMASYSDVLVTYKDTVERISNKLGNTAGICRKAYIDPSEQLLFFRTWGYRPPDMLKRDVFVDEQADIYKIEDKIQSPEKLFNVAAQREQTTKRRRKLSQRKHEAA